MDWYIANMDRVDQLGSRRKPIFMMAPIWWHRNTNDYYDLPELYVGIAQLSTYDLIHLKIRNGYNNGRCPKNMYRRSSATLLGQKQNVCSVSVDEPGRLCVQTEKNRQKYNSPLQIY